ncbi:MAG: ABC transporter substrate-binding protein, partial [Candidatus Brocadiae bacterium]|nr:ABC transporter substrate-binding protein [Candidatus Brocadiia bacterium]
MRAALAGLFLVLAGCGDRAAGARPVRIAAASSLAHFLEQVKPGWEGAHPGEILEVSPGASSTLARQLFEGAEADVFLSADRDSLDRAGERVRRETRRILYANRLAAVGVDAPSLATLATAIALAACGGGEADDGEPFSLTLDFYVNPDHAGVFTALERGYFDEVGLDVNPQVPSDPAAPIKQVAAGRTDLAISYEPEVILARDQGLDVVAVAALVNGPLTSLISLPEAGIETAADLASKTVVTAGIPYQAAYLETILRRAGVDPESVDLVDVGFNLMPPVISGRADAMFGGFLNVEGVDLAERGLDPRVVPVDRLGIPTYDELVLVADRERVESDPEPIRAFLAALERGTYAAARNPQ